MLLISLHVNRFTISQILLLILVVLQPYQLVGKHSIDKVNNDPTKSQRKQSHSNSVSNTYAIYGDPVERFHNDGRLDGWDHYHHEKDGRIKEIKNKKSCYHSAKAKDDHCLSFQQTYDPDYRGRYHSEVILYRAAIHHQAAYYGMAFKLADDFIFDEPWKKREKAEHIKIHLMQFIASFKDIDCGWMAKTAVPTTMVWLENDDVFTKVRFGDICHDRHNIKDFWIGKVIPGKWHTLVLGVHWHHESKEGWFKVTYDNEEVVNEKKIKTFPNIDNRTFELRVGLYPNWYSWNGKGHPFISQTHQRTKKIYIDEISFGPTYADADPDGKSFVGKLTSRSTKPSTIGTSYASNASSSSVPVVHVNRGEKRVERKRNRRNLQTSQSYLQFNQESDLFLAKKYFIGALAYFKNEGHVIHEWIAHHQKWGIEHIWLIDNSSKDQYDIKKYIKEGYVTLWHVESKIKQRRAYKQHSSLIKPYVRWLAVLDMDEFLYSRQYTNIGQAVNASLVGKLSNTSIINIQMKLFLPGTFKSSASVVESNIHVKNHDNPKYPKCIYNMDMMNDLSIHGEGFEKNESFLVRANETVLNINHYRYNSMEFVYGVKEIRGGGMHHWKYNGKKVIDSVEMDYLEDDTYLRDNSNDIISMCKANHNQPNLRLYPRSRWSYMKRNHLDKYNEFKQWSQGNKTLSVQQIYDIGKYIVSFEWQVGKGYVLNETKLLL